jgi:glutamine synthetase
MALIELQQNEVNMKHDAKESYQNLMDRIQKDNVEMLDLKFVDLAGKFRHVTLPALSFTQSVLTDGVGFDGSSVGFKSVKSGDMCLIPDLDTLFVDPFWDIPTLSMFCNIVEADSREEFIGDPRSMAMRVLSYIRKTKIAQDVHILPEFEFNIFDNMVYQNSPNKSFFEIQSREAQWKSYDTNSPLPGFWLPTQGGYHSAAPGDAFRNIRSEIVKMLQAAGVKVKYHHHEVGASGQQEIELTLSPLVSACDHSMLLKYFTRNIVVKHNLTATFMPKPVDGEAGNGMHIHLKLNGPKGEAFFYDEKDPLGLSDTAYCFIGGVIQHGSSLSAFTNPSTNSFRRLVAGFEAPTNLFFSLGSRNSAIRIPKYATAPDQKRFELRSPDSTSNIYFATAAIIMAGIDGIQKGIHAHEKGWGPMDDLSTASKRVRSRIPHLPDSLCDALKALSGDHQYLKAGGVFTQTLIDGWIKSKMEREVIPLRNRPTPLEYELYYGC